MIKLFGHKLITRICKLDHFANVNSNCDIDRKGLALKGEWVIYYNKVL